MSEAIVNMKKVRATRDPQEFGKTGGNYSFGIAVDKGKDKDGKERGTDFFDVMAFGKVAEIYCKPDADGIPKITKGKLINLTGNLTTDSYEKDGVKINKVQIILGTAEPVGSWKDTGAKGTTTASQVAQQAQADDEDEPPFC